MKKRRIKQNIWGNWKGYVGTRRTMDFGTDEQEAKEWLANEPLTVASCNFRVGSRFIGAQRSGPWEVLSIEKRGVVVEACWYYDGKYDHGGHHHLMEWTERVDEKRWIPSV
jgi:hypothetical protein